MTDGPPPHWLGSTTVMRPPTEPITFDPAADRWQGEYDVVVCDARVAVDVPRIPGLPPAPDEIGPGSPNAYLGVLVDGVPNLFVLGDGTERFVRTCLKWMAEEGATRITSRAAVTADHAVRRDTRRRLRRPTREEVDLSDPYLRDDGVYSGPACMTSGESAFTVPVRLSGHLEPLDGHYHWYGTVDDPEAGAQLKKAKKGSVTLAIGDGPTVPAAVTERTGWGSYRVEGTGGPPFPLAG
ncbi:DUF4873 domain-containing protein [Tsukamurella sp. 8F]|uniref:DUF4873 domain-containing protein n=1 Tax=unclassified Tsukamurella TaxID=2633480 RepID=UPI0023B96900|nr:MULTISPECIES: DUF4873 domain-containing protein [unclassified Tsukamurella]MDF0529030.1 DUF4873 domain-containing protein [Tsukamurella sp. 8J]MDF0587403.1 DUF4873 domain-containing protein [Tsukamurella sp. 8F]